MRNSIEPSRTGNCTNFEDTLCSSTGIVDFSWKQNTGILSGNGTQMDAESDDKEAERMLIHIDDQSPNCLRDNILYYIGGFIVRKLLCELQCMKCKKELMLDPNDPTARNMISYPVYSRFTKAKQCGGLVMPSPGVLKILKATEVVFKRRVINTEIGITREKMLDLKIEHAVMQHLGNGLFCNSDGHFFDHEIGQEIDHLSSLMRMVIQKYVKMRLHTYGKKYTEFVVHHNLPSLRHHLNKTILFRNQ